MRARALLLSLALLGGAALPAAAETPAATAQEQFRQGRAAFKAGDFKQALSLFRESQDLYPATGTLLNLAITEARLDMLATATRHFNEVIQQLPPGDERIALAKKELSAIEGRVPRLRVDLARSAAPGSQVTLDGAPLAPSSLATEVPVDAGDHVVEVTAPGRKARRYDVKLENSRTSALLVESGPAVPAAPAAAPPDEVERPASSRRTIGFVVGGIGLVGVGVGAATGIVALGKKSDVDEMCPEPDMCTPEGVDIADSGRTMSIVSTIAFAAGAVGVGAGLYLVLTGGGEDDAPSASVRASLLPGGGGLGVRGRF